MTARNRLGASARGTPRVPPGAVTPPEAVEVLAAQFETVGAGWPVPVAAALATDTNTANMQVRLFDDTVQEGVGFDIFASSDFDQISFTFIHRAETAPGAAAAVQPNLYVQQMPNNAVMGGFSAIIPLTPLDIPTNEFWQYDTQTISYATLGLTDDLQTKFELTRTGGSASDTLTGDWVLYAVIVTLSLA